MPDKKPNIIRRESFVEKLIRRTLETVGGSVDRLFGRGRKPDALPQTADLGERLRKLIDERAQINQSGRKLAPHLIRLKYAWGQSSDEFVAALKKLENELLIAAIDHVNDHRYATLAPIKISSKADILTEGFAMSLGFDEDDLQNSEAVAVPVEIYAKLLPPEFQAKAPAEVQEIRIKAHSVLPNGIERDTNLSAPANGKANFIVGRIKECDLYLDDASVSKHHASLVFNPDGTLKVADVGSTNGTFVGGERIAYGKAYDIVKNSTVAFGDIKVTFAWETLAPAEIAEAVAADQNDGAIRIGVDSIKRERTNEPNNNSEVVRESNSEIDDEEKTFVEHAAAPETFIDKNLRGAPKTFVDESLKNDSGDNANDSPQTFIDAELSRDLDTFVESIEKGAPQTFVDAALADDDDDGRTFVDPELRGDAQTVVGGEHENLNRGASQAANRSEIVSPADQIVLREAVLQKGANDFSQSLPRLSVGVEKSNRAANNEFSAKQQSGEKPLENFDEKP